MKKRVLLMILDGWGEGRQDHSNAIFTAGTPNIDALRSRYPHSHVSACGEDVGLPDGQMGNSEVGHLNIGAGRVVYQDLVKINRACREHALLQNDEIRRCFEYVRDSGRRLHFLGLCSHGGVHSSLAHLEEFLAEAARFGLRDVFVHCLMDGRDTDPHSGKGFVAELEEHMAQTTGRIASLCGRFYTMDRDKRWDRIKAGYDLLVSGIGTVATSATDALEASYAEGVTDEFVRPTVIVGADRQPLACIEEGDAVIFFNFRNDRAREITTVLTQKDMPQEGMHTLPLYFCCLTPYDDTFTGLHILFDKENVPQTIGEVVAQAGLKQLRIAETEKYAHVTFFFNGGREQVFPGESRILVHSPKVATYDLQPKMSAPEVKDKLIAALDSREFDMIILNFANGDMVGHTGVYDAIVEAVRYIDSAVGEVVEAARRDGYTVIITADHGNADYAVNEDGSPNTAHSLNKVQFVVVDDDVRGVRDGRLCDIAPTMLDLMGIPQPQCMTGESLIDNQDGN